MFFVVSVGFGGFADNNASGVYFAFVFGFDDATNSVLFLSVGRVVCVFVLPLRPVCGERGQLVVRGLCGRYLPKRCGAVQLQDLPRRQLLPGRRDHVLRVLLGRVRGGGGLGVHQLRRRPLSRLRRAVVVRRLCNGAMGCFLHVSRPHHALLPLLQCF